MKLFKTNQLEMLRIQSIVQLLSVKNSINCRNQFNIFVFQINITQKGSLQSVCRRGPANASAFSQCGRLREMSKSMRGGWAGVGYLAARAAETSGAGSTFSEFYLCFIKSQPSTLLTFIEQEATPLPPTPLGDRDQMRTKR